MQAIPSLVGTGTAIAAAAIGLALAQPVDSPPSYVRPLSIPHIASRPSFTRDVRLSSAPNPSALSRSDLTTYTPTAPLVSLAPLPSTSPASATLFTAFNASAAAPVSAALSNASAPQRVQPLSLSSPEVEIEAGAAATILAVAPAYVSNTFPRRSGPVDSLTPLRGSINTASRQHSSIRVFDSASPAIDMSRDSASSHGSWIRRLSIRPLSQHGSPRSSLGPDSPSVSFSYGSAAAMLPPGPSLPPLPPNKLVKRPPHPLTTFEADPGQVTRHRSRAHLPALRRPATSHQRSATLQHFQNLQLDRTQGTDRSPSPSPSPNPSPSDNQLPSVTLTPLSHLQQFSFDQQPYSPLHQLHLSTHLPEIIPGSAPNGLPLHSTFDSAAALTRACSPAPASDPITSFETTWKSFFHLQSVKTNARLSYSRSADSTPNKRPIGTASTAANRRIHPMSRQAAVYLVLPNIFSLNPNMEEIRLDTPERPRAVGPPLDCLSGSLPEQATPSKRAKRSISMQFYSPSTWISRSGSVRRSKRPSDAVSGALNRVLPAVEVFSATNSSAGQERQSASSREWSTSFTGRLSPSITQKDSADPSVPTSSAKLVQHTAATDTTRQRRCTATSSLDHAKAPCQASLGNPPDPSGSPSNLAPSGQDSSFDPFVPGLPSCASPGTGGIYDDDIDFRSDLSDTMPDNMFDSLRTMASGRLRAVETPLESLFDESPPSTAGNGKTKRLSIQEILGSSWDGDTNITEEEEGIVTPNFRSAIPDFLSSPPPPSNLLNLDTVRHAHNTANSTTALTLSNTVSFGTTAGVQKADLHNLSSHEDVDEDWTVHGDSPLRNAQSTPSQNSLFDTKVLSPTARLALGCIGGENLSSAIDSASIITTQDSHLSFPDPFSPTFRPSDRPLSSLFDWSEPPAQCRHSNPDGKALRPRTVHGKQDKEQRGGRSALRKGLVPAHLRSHSVPVGADGLDGLRPGKYATWSKMVSEDWDDDFEFETPCGADLGEPLGGEGSVPALAAGPGFGSGSGSSSGSGFGSGPGFSPSLGLGPGLGHGSSAVSISVPASIQATQPSVRAHSGHLREFSLLVNDLKRLYHHGRELSLLNGPQIKLWKEAEGIIALASPDEDETEQERGGAEYQRAGATVQTADIFDDSLVGDLFLDAGFDAASLGSLSRKNSNDCGAPSIPRSQSHLRSQSPFRPGTRTSSLHKRSVFPPEDDIFDGTLSLGEDQGQQQQEQRHFNYRSRTSNSYRDDDGDGNVHGNGNDDGGGYGDGNSSHQQPTSATAVMRLVLRQEAMQHDDKTALDGKVQFDTNSLKALVKRAGDLRNALAEIVRGADPTAQSPTLRASSRRNDGSPAFTRVFADPNPSTPTVSPPSRRLTQKRSNRSALRRGSIDASPGGMGPCMQMMAVS